MRKWKRQLRAADSELPKKKYKKRGRRANLSMALVLQPQGKNDEAMEMYQKALGISRIRLQNTAQQRAS